MSSTTNEGAPDFGRYIDHTLLRPTGTATDVQHLCREAMKFKMAAVCVFPSYVHVAADAMKGSPVHIATVIAFPFGVTFTSAKENEMRLSASHGAAEADIVINISSLKSGDDAAVEDEMQHLQNSAHELGMITKFIIETAYLSADEKIRICRMANRVRPAFLKTSTGYAPSGATVEDVRLLRAQLDPGIQIKAAGGIRSYKDAAAFIDAGATRIGTSSGVAIIEESRKS